MREDGGTQTPSHRDDRVLLMFLQLLIQELASSLREVSEGLTLGKGFVDEGKVISFAYIPPVHTSVLWTVVDLTKALVDDDWNKRVAE